MSLSAIEIVKEFYRRMNTNDFHSVSQLISENYVLEWPQSKERIRGRDNFVAVNKNACLQSRQALVTFWRDAWHALPR